MCPDFDAFAEDNKYLVYSKTNIILNFLLKISILNHKESLEELIKWSPIEKFVDLLWNSLNLFFKEMYGDQSGKFACGYWGQEG